MGNICHPKFIFWVLPFLTLLHMIQIHASSEQDFICNSTMQRGVMIKSPIAPCLRS